MYEQRLNKYFQIVSENRMTADSAEMLYPSKKAAVRF